MKKLLSLLSVLTISGTSVSTTIAASPYQKQETIKNNYINYSWINNLKNLNRNKKNNKNNFFKITQNISNLNNNIWIFQISLNNKLYFLSENIVYEYDLLNNQKEKIIDGNKLFDSSFSTQIMKFLLFNKIYCASKNKICEYDIESDNQQVIITTEDYYIDIFSLIYENIYLYIVLNSKLYEYNVETKQTKILKNFKNIVWYSIFISNSKLYFIDQNGSIYEYELLELIESNIIYIKKYIKITLYLEYKKQNPNSEIKRISNINLEKLKVDEVIIQSKQKNKSINLEYEINVCLDSNSTFINNSDFEQTQYTISCSKQFTETNTIQKMNGFYKTKSTSNNDNWTAKWSGKFTFKASGSSGIPLVAEGKVEAGFGVSHENSWGKSRNKTITDNSNSSDKEIKTITNTTTIKVPSQPVKIPPHSKISISVTKWKNNINLILNTYQKVEGAVNAYFIDENNEGKTIYISIKDAALILLENNILPSKIKINDNDNSINFLYYIKIKREIIIHQTEIRKSISLN